MTKEVKYKYNHNLLIFMLLFKIFIMYTSNTFVKMQNIEIPINHSIQTHFISNDTPLHFVLSNKGLKY